MSVEQLDVHSSFNAVSNVDKAISIFGEVDEQERKILGKTSYTFGGACFKISGEKKSTIVQSMKWLKMSAEEGYQEGVFVYGCLLFRLNPDLQYLGDEGAWWLTRVEDMKLFEKVGNVHFDSDGLRARRHLTRTLLSGSLSKNQDSVLYRSFFHSGLREVHLLPLISKYLIEEKKIEVDHVDHDTSITEICLHSINDVSKITFMDTSSITSLSMCMKLNNHLLRSLPLLFFLFPNMSKLTLFASQTKTEEKVDLSLLQKVNTSKLEILHLDRCVYDSLSPLSLCDLSSLHTLKVYRFSNHELDPLEGLSSDITRSLKEFELTMSVLQDLSPLSGCDLSSLEKLNLEYSGSLSDLSPLRGSDLSSLKSLTLDFSKVSDLSPLCECKGLALEEINLSRTPIEDLSPLSLLDLSCLKQPIYLSNTKVSDLSPLENISCDGVEVHIKGTPAARRMLEEGLVSPQTVGRVTVTW